MKVLPSSLSLFDPQPESEEPAAVGRGMRASTEKAGRSPPPKSKRAVCQLRHLKARRGTVEQVGFGRYAFTSDIGGQRETWQSPDGSPDWLERVE